jgi:uncharacterized membrane protein
MYMELILFVAVIALAFAARSAHTKINRLENKLWQLSQSEAGSHVSAPATIPARSTDPLHRHDQAFDSPLAPIPNVMQSSYTQTQPTSAIPVPQPVPQPQAPAEPAQPFFLYTWFKDHTLIKVGSIIFFFGAAWFVSYAFEQNWIPPLLRVLMGLGLALAIYLIGYARRAIESLQYIVLTALSSGMMHSTKVASISDDELERMIDLIDAVREEIGE